MKKSILLASAFLLMASCTREYLAEETNDKWNGYEKYLKMGEQTHILWAGKHLNVGTATYGIDDNANFYVKYDCSSTDWSIRETHLFAGDKRYMPLNRCSQPRIYRFPCSSVHRPGVKTYTYRIPLTSLPPAEEPGFAVAAECLVYHNTKCNGHEKSAWAEGDFRFTDKGTGWYDVFYFNQVENEYTILYGITYAFDSLKLYHIDITHDCVELTYSEYVGNTPGTYDAAAYDVDSAMLFFVKVNDNELWVNCLEDEDSSCVAGTLQGEVLSATFSDGVYYYVDALTNTIHGVSFSESWNIASDLVLDTVPASVTVEDIAIGPEGEKLYILGQYNGSTTQLLSWEIASGNFYSSSYTVPSGSQIAFGSDGLLYGIQPGGDGNDSAMVWAIDIESGILTVISDEIIFIDDPFSDITRGPTM